jgi:hypothetical protein
VRFGTDSAMTRIWSSPDVIGLFSINVVSFSRNVVLSGLSFSLNCGSGMSDVVGSSRLWPDCTKGKIKHGKGAVILVNDQRSGTLSDKPNALKRRGSQHPDLR